MRFEDESKYAWEAPTTPLIFGTFGDQISDESSVKTSTSFTEKTHDSSSEHNDHTTSIIESPTSTVSKNKTKEQITLSTDIQNLKETINRLHEIGNYISNLHQRRIYLGIVKQLINNDPAKRSEALSKLSVFPELSDKNREILKKLSNEQRLINSVKAEGIKAVKTTHVTEARSKNTKHKRQGQDQQVTNAFLGPNACYQQQFDVQSFYYSQHNQPVISYSIPQQCQHTALLASEHASGLHECEICHIYLNMEVCRQILAAK